MTHDTSLSTTDSATTIKGGSRPWLALNGLLLISLGLLFLFAATFFKSTNWWAAFILIPAVGLLGGAWLAYRLGHGTFNVWLRLNLSFGLVILTVALIFALGLDWGFAWPLMLMVPGAMIFLNGFTLPRRRLGHPLTSVFNLLFWLGASVALLGLTLLLNQLGLISLQSLFGNFRWWGAFILLPGLGALFNGLAIKRDKDAWAATGDNLLALGVMLCISAGGEFLGLPVQWSMPITLGFGGLAFLMNGLRQK